MSPRTAALLALAALSPALRSAEPPRPPITGLARVSFYAHDVPRSLLFYRDFLGFAALPPDGSAAPDWIKIGDRQFVELRPEKEAGTDRLAGIAFETADAEALRAYLAARGVAVPEKAAVAARGCLEFSVPDPEGHAVAFVQFPPDSAVARDFGRDLPPTRIAPRMSHGGIVVRHLEAELRFYRDLLGFRETWRGSKDGKTLSWVNLAVPEGRDYAELMLYDTLPPLARLNTAHHLCLELPDVPKAAEILKSRPLPPDEKPATRIATGVNGKRQINYYDPDGTRVEVMEPGTLDGKPAPSSPAPPPNPGT